MRKNEREDALATMCIWPIENSVWPLDINRNEMFPVPGMGCKKKHALDRP